MQTKLKSATLIDLFNESLAGIEPLDKTCLEIVRADREESLTFEQLRMRACDFAVWLIRAKGIRPKDKIAILGKNRADWDVALWGTILAGAVPVLIDPERPVEGVKNHVTHTEARLIIAADDYQDADSRRELSEFASSSGIACIEMTVFDREIRRVGLGPPNRYGGAQPHPTIAVNDLLDTIAPQVKVHDTAVILCTSGTTGDPREVELTHGNLIANLQGSVEKVQISHTDTLGHILPPHHSFGLTVGKLLPFCVGATNVYTNKYRHVAELIRDKGVTIFVAVPALFTMLAKSIEESLAKERQENLYVRLLDRHAPKLVGKGIFRKLGWDKLRFFLSGSAPVPKWVLEVFWRRGLLLYEGYGTTENSPVYGFNDNPAGLGSVGKPISTLSVKIVSPENRTLPAGEKGEIALGGPCVMKGYYKNPQSTQAVIVIDDHGARWLLTGDLGYLDDEGNLHITGRKKYLIVLPGGKKVNPERVESALSEAQFVGEVLVVPGFWKDADGIEQETIRAIVRPALDTIETHAKLSSADLQNQPKLLKSLIWQSINECQQKSRHLSSFEKISSQHLEIRIEEFAKTSTGKIKREVYMKL
jgi:long-chain acyl-CoA synthetase